MSKIVGCIIARTTSTRLPHKVLRRVYNKFTILDVIIQRMKKVTQIDELYIATSSEPADDILEDYAYEHGIKIYRGSAENVISRMIEIGKIENATHLIRITGDNVFTDHEILQYQIRKHLEFNWEYSRTEGVPVGSTAELINFETLVDCSKRIDPNESEYMMLYLFNPDIYKVGVMLWNTQKKFNNFTLTVDTPNDLQRTREILQHSQNIYINTWEIVKCIEKYEIKNSIMQQISSVKLPKNQVISYDKFRKDMDNRLKKAQIVHFGEVY